MWRCFGYGEWTDFMAKSKLPENQNKPPWEWDPDKQTEYKQTEYKQTEYKQTEHEKLISQMMEVVQDRNEALNVASRLRLEFSTNTNYKYVSLNETMDFIDILTKSITLHPADLQVVTQSQIALSDVKHYQIQKIDSYWRTAQTQLKFSFKPLFRAKQYNVFRNPHSNYHISYFPVKDGDKPRSLEIRVSLFPTCDKRMILNHGHQKKNMMTSLLKLPKKAKIMSTHAIFGAYVANVTQDVKLLKLSYQCPKNVIKVKNALMMSKQNLYQISNNWSSSFKFGYAIGYLRSNYEFIVVNVLFNDQKLFHKTNVFEIKFRNRNKCQVCKKKK
eukprot:432370_1